MAKTTRKAAKQTTTTLKKAASTLKQAVKGTTTKAAGSDFFGLPLKTWIESARAAKGAEVRSGSRGFVFALTTRDAKQMKAIAQGHLSKWQLDHFLKSEADSNHFQGLQGPVWFLRVTPPTNRQAAVHANQALEKSNYARFRDLAGSILSQVLSFKVEKLVVETRGLSLEEESGVLLGLELASYSFAENRNNPKKTRKTLPTLLLKMSEDMSSDEIQGVSRLALSMNIARHLVNLPAGVLNPRTYSNAVIDLFRGSRSSEVDVWAGDKLNEENMNLMLAVGGGAEDGPALVRISYRPRNAKAGVKPIAIVGKGITFDTGGLDMKPSSAMRWMKKDMGGSAAAVAIAKWAEDTGLEIPLDVYLALAENAVSDRSFRPGDIITARSGTTVEIHNTDAEGRLVLADALDVAVTREGDDAPQAVIDIATLTGAIKVGLGAEIAGLFSNNDDLADQLEAAGLAKGDLSWRMPLFQQYKSLFRSTFADYANASDGFGGAITAALFLELFVRDVPWAHLDIYAWKDGSGGPFAESGGNGQPVQALAEFLTRFANRQLTSGVES